jgi:GNAT superfamily N-acetyltransferase
MPRAHVVAVDAIDRTPRVLQVEGMFDVPPADRQERSWEVDLDLDEEWKVGLLVGPSGSGKTRVARALWPEALVTGYDWSPTAALVDEFPDAGIEQITGALAGVGLGSIPAWLRPYASLSTGEQFRATLARALLEQTELVVVDEFTSTVDRQVAKVASAAVAKHVRRGSGKLVCVTCHYDVVDWLQPDWIYQPHLNEFARRRLRRRPQLEMEIAPLDPACWAVFRHHHYLTGVLHPHAYRNCAGAFIDGECVAFVSWMRFMHPHVKNTMKGHRLVVLPDWQGLGIAGRLIDWLGEHLWTQGLRFHVTVAHPALIAYCRRSPRWASLAKTRNLRTGPSALTPWRSTEPRILGLHSFRWQPPIASDRVAKQEDPSAGRVEPGQSRATPTRNRRRKKLRVAE